MKENICMRCRRRSCSFWSYTREDCPYEPKLPQLYEHERDSESDTEKQRGQWFEEEITKIIKCSLCDNDAPISTVSGAQYESKYCPSCGAKMDGEEGTEK